MKLKISSEFRQHIHDYISAYNHAIKRNEKTPIFKIDTKEIVNTIHFISMLDTESHKDIYKYLKDEMLLAYLGVSSTTYFSLAIYQEEMKNPIDTSWISDSSSYRDPNFVMQHLFAHVNNNAMSVIRLIEAGLDTQARAMLRVLAESIFIAIYVFSSKEVYSIYSNDTNQDTGRETWNKVFRNKKIHSKLTNLEKELGLPNDIVDDLSRMRSVIYKEFSEIIHSSFLPTIIGSRAGSFNDDVLHIGLCGKASIGSKSTNYYLNWLLFYFTIMTNGLLSKLHNYKPPLDNLIWRTAIPIRECFINVYIPITYKEELRR